MLEIVTAQIGVAMFAQGSPIERWDLNGNFGITRLYLLADLGHDLIDLVAVRWHYMVLRGDLVTEHIYNVTYYVDSSADEWLGDGKGAIKSPWIA